MRLIIHFENSADINEFDICTSLDCLQAFIKETIENLQNPEEKGIFIGESLFDQVIVSKPGDDYCCSYIRMHDPVNRFEHLFEDYHSDDSVLRGFGWYDVSFQDKHTLVCEDGYYIEDGVYVKINFDLESHAVESLIDRMIEDEGIRAFDSVEFVLHPAYKQRQVEITLWLCGYLNEMFGLDTISLSDFGDNGFIDFGYK